MSYSKQQARPVSVGTKVNLPDDIREMAGLRSEVLAWTALDPDHEGDIGHYACCQAFGPLLVLPCFWPHMIILSPCLCAACSANTNRIKNQYWILCDNELKIVSKSFDTCCIPGCSQSGNNIKTIPLANITDCGVQASGKGCTNQCTAQLPTIYVDTASVTASSPGQHEATAVALAGSEWFVKEILNRRDIVMGRAGAPTYADAAVVEATVAMDRGDRSAADRINEITKLHETGILTKEEFDKKRQDIIASI
jgi:hypothetical protein